MSFPLKITTWNCTPCSDPNVKRESHRKSKPKVRSRPPPTYSQLFISFIPSEWGNWNIKLCMNHSPLCPFHSPFTPSCKGALCAGCSPFIRQLVESSSSNWPKVWIHKKPLSLCPKLRSPIWAQLTINVAQENRFMASVVVRTRLSGWLLWESCTFVQCRVNPQMPCEFV